MDTTTLLRRGFLVFAVVATGSFLAVYFFNDWFHQVFLSSLGVAQPLGDAIGSVIMVAAAYILQRAVSIAFYRDQMLGLNRLNSKDENRLSNFQMVANEVSAELKQIRDFNEVVRGQLKSVINATENAAFGIVERLQTIDGVVTKLDRFVAGTTDETAQLVEESEKRIGQNQAIVTKIEGYVQQRLHEAELDQARVAQVAEQARSLESLVQLIKHVAGQTNLLALNAAIEAARAGEAGRGFAVVADEVRKLSGETENAVVQISQGIKMVAETIETQFQDKLSNANLYKEKALLDNFSGQLNKLGQNYEELMHHETSVLSEIQSSSSQLSAMFLDAQAGIQFQDVTRQQIEHVIQALEQLDGHAALLADRLRAYEDPNFTYTPISKHLDTLYSGYVMEEERTTHKASLRGGVPAESVAAAPAKAPASNVELF